MAPRSTPKIAAKVAKPRRDSAATKRRLLAAATEEFAERGVAGARVEPDRGGGQQAADLRLLRRQGRSLRRGYHGIYCSSLPCPCLKPGGPSPSSDPPWRSSCRRIRGTVVVRLDDDRWPLTTDHILDAIRSGERRIPHLDRRRADQHRAEATRGTDETRLRSRRVSAGLLARGGTGCGRALSDNRGAGASLGSQMRRYCNGQWFRVRVF